MKMKTIEIEYDDNGKKENYWTSIPINIQRIILVIIVINTIRMVIAHRKRERVVLKKRSMTQLPSNKFEVMVKVNSKKSV